MREPFSQTAVAQLIAIPFSELQLLRVRNGHKLDQTLHVWGLDEIMNTQKIHDKYKYYCPHPHCSKKLKLRELRQLAHRATQSLKPGLADFNHSAILPPHDFLMLSGKGRSI